MERRIATLESDDCRCIGSALDALERKESLAELKVDPRVIEVLDKMD